MVENLMNGRNQENHKGVGTEVRNQKPSGFKPSIA